MPKLKLPFPKASMPAAQDKMSSDKTQQASLQERVEGLLKQHSISVAYADEALRKIPQVGRLIVVSNDPLPGVSMLAILSLVSRVRPDIQFIGDRHSAWLSAFQDIAATSDHDSARSDGDGARTGAAGLDSLVEHLANEGVLILQPVHFGKAEGVPKLTQERWPVDFLKLAEHTLSPLLHIHVSSDEQPFLQQARILYRGDGVLRKLARRVMPDVYNQKLKVGDLIDAADYKDLPLKDKFKAKLLRKQLYRVAADKSSYFKTMPAIAEPESRTRLINELKSAQLLGETKDRKLIYLCDLESDSSLLNEIGRLREQAFRLVGEGSGTSCDVDDFDLDYQHIVLWDAQDHEVVGAYRLRSTFDANPSQLYTSTLMDYQSSAESVLHRGVELGRSFVQPKYWGSRSLDYLWAGIAAYLRQHPRVRYLLGAVSISNAFSQQAKDLLLGYYSRYYLTDLPIIKCKRPYIMGYEAKERNMHLFEDLNAREAFVVLREQLGLIGHSVPTLYKQYTELCDDGGTKFHGFNIDPDFQDCIDGLVVVDLHHLKPLKRKRYGLESHDFLHYEASSPEPKQIASE